MVDEIETILEKELHCKTIRVEGIEAIGIKRIIWNWLPCPYSGKCYLQKEKEKNQPKPCSYNPKMFKCSAYQDHERHLND